MDSLSEASEALGTYAPSQSPKRPGTPVVVSSESEGEDPPPSYANERGWRQGSLPPPYELIHRHTIARIVYEWRQDEHDRKAWRRQGRLAEEAENLLRWDALLSHPRWGDLARQAIFKYGGMLKQVWLNSAQPSLPMIIWRRICGMNITFVKFTSAWNYLDG